MSEGASRQIADDAVELDVNTSEEAQRLARYLREQGRWREVVPGLSSVTVMFDPLQTPAKDTLGALNTAALAAPDGSVEATDVLEIAVRYGGDAGPDLEQVCQTLGLSEVEFIDAHTGAVHTVDMIGFTPGFAYMSGIDETLSVPRLPVPRSRLPAGSVGISGAYTGLYALAGPGGWPIIGQAETTLFNPQAEDPFLLHPGQRVIFKAI